MAKLASFRGLHALVTGASSGIGRALALRLAREGARLSLVARREAELQEVASEVGKLGGEARVFVCDVIDRAQVEETALRATEQGAVDLLVCNAGYGHHRRFLDWSVDDMERMMRVNYLGTLYFTKALLDDMVARRRGWIVFIASAAGKIAVPDESAYVASKFAMVGLGEAISYELAEHGVHLLNVCPGAVRTDFFDDEALERLPSSAKRLMVEVEPLVERIMRALKRGDHELIYPGVVRVGWITRALFPRFMRWSVRRATMKPGA